MAYKQKGYPQHNTGLQSKNQSPVKMSESSEATLIGVGTGAASGAAAGAVLGPWGAAVGAVVGGTIGGITANKSYKDNKALEDQQAAINAELKAQENTAKERALQSRFASEKAKTSARMPGKIERINPDGTVTNSTEIGGTPANLGKLYAPLKNPITKKGIIKPKKELKRYQSPSSIKKMSAKQGEAITKFNKTSMNIANEPSGTDVAIRKSKK